MSFKFNPFTGNFDEVGSGSSTPSSWKAPVADFASLPGSGNSDGDARIVLDTYQPYVWDGGAWIVFSSAAGSYFVDNFTLNGTDISNKFVTLSGTPTTASGTILNIVGGVVQDYSVDFTITGDQLSWNGLGLDGVLASGDKLIVQYN
jgi:hypothetical protein